MAAKKKEETGDVSKRQMEQLMQKVQGRSLELSRNRKMEASQGLYFLTENLMADLAQEVLKLMGQVLLAKTHAVLTCISNGLKSIPNSKGVWFDAEGRLSDDIKERIDATFVYDASEWEVGNYFSFGKPNL